MLSKSGLVEIMQRNESLSCKIIMY